MDRTLTAKGVDISDLTMLDRLAFVGSKGMGALIYKPEIGDGVHDQFEFELDKIAKATQKIISGTPTEILDELYILSGSVGFPYFSTTSKLSFKVNHSFV